MLRPAVCEWGGDWTLDSAKAPARRLEQRSAEVEAAGLKRYLAGISSPGEAAMTKAEWHINSADEDGYGFTATVKMSSAAG